MSVELSEQLRAIAEILAGGHAGLSSPVLSALENAATRLENEKGKSDDLVVRLRGHANALSRPGAVPLKDLVETLNEAAERV
jgi:hypothetical protein